MIARYLTIHTYIYIDTLQLLPDRQLLSSGLDLTEGQTTAVVKLVGRPDSSLLKVGQVVVVVGKNQVLGLGVVVEKSPAVEVVNLGKTLLVVMIPIRLESPELRRKKENLIVASNHT